MRALAALALAAALGAAAAPAPAAQTAAPTPAPPPAWATELSAAREALARGDSAAARAGYERADSLVGGHPNLLLRLAAFAARRGDRAEAFRRLDEFAAMGLARALDRDSSFAALAGDPRFTALLDTIRARTAPVARAVVARRLDDAGMLAEDVAKDGGSGRTFVSSIHRRKVVAVDSAGRVSDFTLAGKDSVWGIYALGCDATRGTLWATTAAGPTCEGYVPADSGRTALLAYDLDSSALRHRYELPRDGARHVLGDLTIAPDGTVYVTESLGGGVYRLAPGGAALDTLAPAGSFGSPQTPVLTGDGARLLIPDYLRGIASLGLHDGQIQWLAKPRSLASAGIDGLYRVGDRLIAIQNGATPRRVLELTLDSGEARILGWRVLEQASDLLGEPNHGVLVGTQFWFIGNSGWERVNEREELETPADAKPPVLLLLTLDR